MSELDARLSQLREAADQFARAGRCLQQSAQTVQDTIRELYVLNLLEGQPPLVSQVEAGQLWADSLAGFSTSLQRAADDIESAVQVRLPHFNTSLLRNVEAASLPSASTGVFLVDPRLSTPVNYVSAANAPLFEELQQRRAVLAQQQDTITALRAERDQAAADLRALRNQLQSRDPALDARSVPEVQALQSRIASLDADLASAASAAERVNADIAALEARLSHVTPGAGADILAIHALETGQSSPVLLENTFGCVRHIAGRMPIPAAMAVDARAWVQAAAIHPQYGITSGAVPLAGSVLVMPPEHSYADDLYGHVMYVERVEDGVVWITDNDHPTSPVRLDELTGELGGEHVTYLYFPWHTRA